MIAYTEFSLSLVVEIEREWGLTRRKKSRTVEEID